MESPLVSKRMMQELRNFYNTLAIVQKSTITVDSNSGEEINTFITDELYSPIPCYVEPVENRGNNQIRRDDGTIVQKPFTIGLQGYYPRLTTKTHLIIQKKGQTQETHAVIKVAHDDTETVTFLTTEVVIPKNPSV